ncbi:MFS transporter [Streptomyces sp. MS1.HAVA.3]|uniref:MFS transporter n=1 Tax=Streptomyces caledonius TaxID=3134107 RepID=A0ABU8UD52_9ACTN
MTGVPAGRLADRFGARRMTAVGLVAMAAGSFVLSVAPSALGILGYVVPLAVVTAGYAVFQTANNTSVMADVLPDRRGVVSGLLNLSRNLGLVTGASVMGAVFAGASATTDVTRASAAAVGAGMRTTFLVAALLVLAALAVALGSGYRGLTAGRNRTGKARTRGRLRRGSAGP